MAPLPIPQPDPVPLAAPVWLLRLLLLVTFTAHALAMNITLGGGLLAVFYRVRAASSAFAARLSRDLTAVLPVSTGLTITLGVAPLLIVQVLYGNFFYTSSILVGGFWMLVLPLLIAGYYGYYYSASRPGGRWQVSAAAAAPFLLIAFIYTNNMTLALAPERWLTIHQANPAGWNLNLAEPMVPPRYLHMVVAAGAVAGLAVALAGLTRLKADEAYGRWLIVQGSRWFAGATAIQFVVGTWFLLSLPARVRDILLGKDPVATLVFGAALLMALVAMMTLSRASTAPKPAAVVLVGAGHAVAAIFLMVVVRDLVRNAYLKPHFDVGSLPVASQPALIAAFFVLFAAGLAAVGWMLHAVLRRRLTVL